MTLKLRAAGLLHIRPGEGAPVGRLFLFSYLLGLSSLFLETTSNTLFLAEVGAASIPLVYLASALVLVLAGLAFSKLESRVAPARLLTEEIAFLLVSITAFMAALAAFPHSRAVVLGLMIWKEAVFTLSQLVFWALAGTLLDVRQGKRLFGLVSTGFVLADFSGGITAAAVVKALGIPMLLVLSAAGAALSLVLFRRMVRRFSDRFRRGEDTDEAAGTERRSTPFLRNKFVRVILVMCLPAILGFYFVDFIFMKQVEIQYPDPLRLAGFFGIFYAALGLANMAGSLLVAGRLLERFGVGFGMILLPAFLGLAVGCVVAVLAVPGLAPAIFGTVVIAKFGHEFLLASIATPAGQILYQAVPTADRLRLQNLKESIFEPAATGLSGLLLLALVRFLGLPLLPLAIIILAIIIPWIILAIILKKSYLAALVTALRRRRIGGEALKLSDASSLAVLRKRLRSPRPFEVIACLKMLEEMGHANLSEFLSDALGHASAEVRTDALDRIGRARLKALAPAVLERLREDLSPGVKAAALRALVDLDGTRAAAEAEAVLDAADPDVRLAAFKAIVRSGGDKGREIVLRVARLAESGSGAERAFAGRVAGGADQAGLEGISIRLLGDDDPDVRTAALEAVGTADSARLWEAVLRNIDDPRSRRPALTALAAGGPAAEAAVTEAVGRRAADPAWRILLVRVLGRSAGPGGIEVLVGLTGAAHQELSFQSLRALRKRGYRSSPEKRPELEKRVRENAAAAAWALDRKSILGSNEAFAYLEAALADGFRQIVKKILLFLSFLYDPEAVVRASGPLVSEGSSADAARALEVLDSLLSRELKPLVFPLIDGLAPEERLRRMAKVVPLPKTPALAEALGEIGERARAWGDSWLESGVLYAVGSARIAAAKPVLEAKRMSPDPLLRETAKWAEGKLDRESAVSGDRGPMLLFEKVILLKNTVLFSETSEHVLVPIAAALEMRAARPGETIIREGEPGDRMYLLVKGRVRISTRSGMSLQLGAGDVFGEFALIDDAPRTATVTVTDEAVLFAVPRDVFRDILAERTEVAFDFIRVMARRLRQKLAAKHARQSDLSLPVPPAQDEEDVPDIEAWLPVEQMLFLGSIPLFSGLPEPALKDVAAAMKKVRAAAGETVVAKGETGTSFYLVVSGRLRVHDGERTLAGLEHGQIFGELAVLDSEVRMASVTAESSVQMFRLDQEALFDIMADQPDLASAVMTELARRIREEEDLILRLSSL